jgi:acetylornithine deacetylase/succinyl-diaminopimelate desuccinylase-like protein
VQAFLETVLGEAPPLEEALDRARELHPLAAQLVAPLLSATLSPTMIEASRKRNIIPAVCAITVDCRLPPGTTPADVEPEIRRVLGDDVEYEIEFTEAHGGTRSALDSPLMRAAESFVAEIDPGSRVAPMITAGFTDSHWLRDAFGTTAYGFFPVRMAPELMAQLIHSADERIPIDDLELGLSWLRHAARTLLS